MKNNESKSNVKTVEMYVAPVLKIIDINIDQSILTGGSGNSILNDIQGEYW